MSHNICPHCGCGCRHRGRWSAVSLGLVEMAMDISEMTGRLARAWRLRKFDRMTAKDVRAVMDEARPLLARVEKLANRARLP